MLYELRIYNALPGKLSELHARFRDHTNAIFARHGFKPVGYWTNLIGPSNQQLIYILEWEDLAHCEAAWEAFKADPEWIAVKSASEKGGSILQPSDYSLMQ